VEIRRFLVVEGASTEVNMQSASLWKSFGLGVCLLLLSSANAGATDFCGSIVGTFVITENSELVCDVECLNLTGACIQFGSDHIKLRLNGFKLTGQANPPANCVSTPQFGRFPGDPGPFPYDGVSTGGFDHVEILGPGLIERFPRHGIFVFETEKSTVKHVTSHHNCFSGLFLGLSNDNDIEENVSARNGLASGGAPCGGNCISFSNNNRIHRNEFAGNGSVAPGGVGVPGTPTLMVPNDFGVGLVGSSTGNVIQENGIGGNINGILITFTARGNTIRRNVVAGNPPVQVGSTPVGADIRDFAPAGTNAFEENLCITYTGATVPPPCPNFPKFAGHHNTSQSSSGSK
jgi:hypothetical protein